MHGTLTRRATGAILFLLENVVCKWVRSNSGDVAQPLRNDDGETFTGNWKCRFEPLDSPMISLAVTIFIFGLIAIALGFSGVGSLAMNAGWFLLIAGIIIAIIHAVRGKRVG